MYNDSGNGETNDKATKDIIHSYLYTNVDSEVELIHSDKSLAEIDIDYVSANNEAFKVLLNNYVQASGNNLKAKLFLKKAFFWICMVFLIGMFALILFVTLFCLLNNVKKETLAVALINNIISFISAFMVLPKIIAEYLFNPEEEKDTISLIKNIQEHDTSIRSGMK